MALLHRPKSYLRDYLGHQMCVLFVGINPGLRSAGVGHHFAGYSNRFWKLLYGSGLIPVPLTYRDDWRLPEYGLGITNIISKKSADSSVLGLADYRAGFASLERKIRYYRPRIVALLGVTIYRMLFLQAKHTARSLSLGPTTTRLAGTPIFLLANPSGRNAHYSYEQMLKAFIRLHKHVRELDPKGSTKGVRHNRRS